METSEPFLFFEGGKDFGKWDKEPDVAGEEIESGEFEIIENVEI